MVKLSTSDYQLGDRANSPKVSRQCQLSERNGASRGGLDAGRFAKMSQISLEKFEKMSQRLLQISDFGAPRHSARAGQKFHQAVCLAEHH